MTIENASDAQLCLDLDAGSEDLFLVVDGLSVAFGLKTVQLEDNTSGFKIDAAHELRDGNNVALSTLRQRCLELRDASVETTEDLAA